MVAQTQKPITMKKYNEMNINERINWKNQLSCCNANKNIFTRCINSVAPNQWFYSWLWLKLNNDTHCLFRPTFDRNIVR